MIYTQTLGFPFANSWPLQLGSLLSQHERILILSPGGAEGFGLYLGIGQHGVWKQHSRRREVTICRCRNTDRMAADSETVAEVSQVYENV